MNKIITALIICVSLFGNIGVSESADCAALYASAPKDIQETYIPRCKEDVAKAKNGDADAAWGIGALYDREKKYAVAVKWFSLAAEKQHYRAMENLAYTYAFFLKDDVRSLMWLNLIKDKKQFQNNVTTSVYRQVKSRLNQDQIKKANGLAEDCIRKKYKGC